VGRRHNPDPETVGFKIAPGQVSAVTAVAL